MTVINIPLQLFIHFQTERLLVFSATTPAMKRNCFFEEEKTALLYLNKHFAAYAM